MSVLPSVTQIRELPTTLTARVTPDLLDENNHMNIRHYFNFQKQAFAEEFQRQGIDSDYPVRTGSGVFTLEQHISYAAECLLDDQISVHIRIIDFTDKTIHSIGYLVNDTRNVLSYVVENMIAHVNLETRRIAPWPNNIFTLLSQRTENAPDWTPHTAGCLKTRSQTHAD